MRLLYATQRPYLPESMSGAELCTDTLLRGLVARGHACELVTARLSGFRARLEHLGARLAGRVLALDAPYAVHRVPEDEVVSRLDARIAEFAPDLVVTHLKGSEVVAERALAHGLPVVLMVRDAEFEWLTGRLPRDARVHVVANSRFVAARVRERLGLEPQILRPLVRRERFLAPRREPAFVTFVNPIRLKGVQVALALARAMPGQRFLFVRSWAVAPKHRAHLDRRLRRVPNVELLQVQDDMRPIYARTSVLLAPSQWEESFPRVIVEAHLNGIPVLASDAGGIAEALGAGGLLLPRDAPVKLWVEALRRLLAPGPEREGFVREALLNAARPELDSERIVDAFVSLASSLLAGAA